MSRKKLQKYCQLTQAIKAYDAEFFQALDDLCLLPLLRSGPNGVTFCYPEEKQIRKKIIDATYSKNPEMAVKMVKALILRGCYRKPEELRGTVSNALNHMVELKDGKWHSFKLAPAKDLEFFDHRGNIAVLLLQGKGDIPLTGEMAPRMNDAEMARSKKETVGGSWGCGCMCWPSHRVALAKKMAKCYVHEQNKKSNVYVKKVCLQLSILEKDHPEIYNSERLLNHLGNEEVSDSYLLDMISPDDVMCKLWKAVGQSSDGLGELSEDMVPGSQQTYHQKYLAHKDARIKQGRFKDSSAVSAELKSHLDEQKRLLNNVVAVCDLREAASAVYSNRDLLGKDLFIVYTSVMKEMWENEHDMESFNHYSYMATHVYTSCDEMADQEFNQFKDATLYGNLLKSDVFKFVPWVDVSVYVAAGYSDGVYPKPIDLKIYSLNSLVSKLAANKVGGGAQSVLAEYL